MGFSLFGNKDTDDKSKKTQVPVGSILRYMHSPEIGIRIRRIGEKLGYFSFLIALVYRSARLLPAGHPMLDPRNIGRYGVRDVIATAANRLVMKRENMDQILIFGAVLAAIVMVIIQAVLIGFYSFMNTAHAAGMFETPAPSQDIIFQFLRNVFGQNAMFGGSGSATAVQQGLYAILGFYSTAMMIVACIIVIYYVITIVGESAQTGTPFGKRFNGLWAPVRLVLALGLLVPLGGGLNTAQYLVLNVAKLGSGLASQGWKTFVGTYANTTATGGFGAPNVSNIGMAVFSSEACRAAFNQVYSGSSKQMRIYMSYLPSTGARTYTAASFTDAEITSARNAGATAIDYVWAAGASTSAKPDVSASKPCGTISMALGKKLGGSPTATDTALDSVAQGMEGAYIAALNTMVSGLGGISSQTDTSPAVMLAKKVISYGSANWASDSASDVAAIAQGVASVIDSAQTQLNAAALSISSGMTDLGTGLITKMKAEADTRGWGTAGAYFSSISKINYMAERAAMGPFPTVKEGPSPTGTGDKEGSSCWSWFQDCKAGEAQKQISLVYRNMQRVNSGVSEKLSVFSSLASGAQRPAWQRFGVESDSTGIMSRPLYTLAVWQFGDGFLKLFDAPTTNPMPVLVEAGGKILDGSYWIIVMYIIANVGGVLASIVGGVAGMFVGGPGGLAVGAVSLMLLSQVLAAASGILWLMITVGLAVGIVLFYLLPLMPFMYFTFSTINWVIEVAEAFVSMPLFALAHLRIDGEGMPGQTAYSGYLTLFGVMMRPLLIVVGLIVSSLIFGAGVYFINSVYLEAIMGYRPGATADMKLSEIGSFGLVTYLILYVYMIYTLASSSFKLIDTIPDKMMRWIGGSTPFTGDKPADIGHFQNMALAGYAVMSQAKNVGSSFAGIGKVDPNLGSHAGTHMRNKLGKDAKVEETPSSS